MSLITVSPEELISKSRIYLQAKQGIESEIQKVNSMNQTLTSVWQGKAFNAYLSQYDQLKIQVQKFENLLEQINSQINIYANSMQQKDLEDSRRFGL
ncbi:MAG: WXG100 family type VII secretion target [Lactobacillaceae bacterium]|jgi:WXG100 family type VII secretion target|nr:WXG100 family type VII secretion target [Lactobacillaceae bacterium]